MSAAASNAEQSETGWERRTANGAEAGGERRGDAGGADEADDEPRPEDWYNQLLEQGFSEVSAPSADVHPEPVQAGYSIAPGPGPAAGPHFEADVLLDVLGGVQRLEAAKCPQNALGAWCHSV